ncbi:SDR family NAD(P)-dependent oxidoreductase [Wenzhouxiangella sp. XN24]|uniref:SDR family oxidoreductase n=1 Tax=Wenzhouxiangella sp. XN24 TaxID=2713569 RepID=UPI0013ECFD84|nr:SDR family NAD(P)-dependent oxidoreductase [Wenzhouxiangella sp. XN24]NGX16368.1 SDR family NAD(P)-dependent oxidoreductase [Wenzhouxiangella sp. XN24]
MDLRDRDILLTGGTNGIGLALTGQLVGAGVRRIFVVGRDPARLDAVAARFPGRIEPLRADLSVPTEVDRLVAAMKEGAPDLSIVINNAGVQTLTDFICTDAGAYVPELRAEIEANFAAVVALTCGLLPHLIAQPSAMVVNVTSGLALAPKKSSPVYCATKAAVRAFSKGLRYQALDHAPQLKVVEALPPLVDTDMTRGRGRGKISADACARQILQGMRSGRDEIYVGKSRLLRAIQGLSPALADRIMRNG